MSMLLRVATENCRKGNRLAQRNAVPVASPAPDATSAALEIEGAKLARISISGGPNSSDSGYSTETELTDNPNKPLDELAGNDSNSQDKTTSGAVQGSQASTQSVSIRLQAMKPEEFPILPRPNPSHIKGKNCNQCPLPEGTAQAARNKIWAKSRLQNFPAGSIFVRHLGSIQSDWTRSIFPCNCEDHKNGLKRKKFAQELEKERADASVETRTLPPPRYKYAPKKHTHYASKDPSPLKTVQLLAEDPTTHKKASRRGVKSKVSNSCSGRAERKPSSHRGSKFQCKPRRSTKFTKYRKAKKRAREEPEIDLSEYIVRDDEDIFER